MICNDCGGLLKTGAKYCNTCGSPASPSQSLEGSRVVAQQSSSAASQTDNQATPTFSANPGYRQSTAVCMFHSETVAAGVCVSCGNFFCRNCLFSSGGRNYCQGCWARHGSAPLGVQPYYQPTPIQVQPVQYVQFVPKQKEPGIALLLSFLMPGVGQIYNGQVGKGVIFLISFWILVWFVVGIGIWIWAMVDAYQTANRINMGQRV